MRRRKQSCWRAKWCYQVVVGITVKREKWWSNQPLALRSEGGLFFFLLLVFFCFSSRAWCVRLGFSLRLPRRLVEALRRIGEGCLWLGCQGLTYVGGLWCSKRYKCCWHCCFFVFFVERWSHQTANQPPLGAMEKKKQKRYESFVGPFLILLFHPRLFFFFVAIIVCCSVFFFKKKQKH